MLWIQSFLPVLGRANQQKQAEELMALGHSVNINRMEEVDITDMKDFKIIDRVDVDITNRGVDTSMSDRDRNRKYMEIRKIPTEDWELYERCAIEVIETSES